MPRSCSNSISLTLLIKLVAHGLTGVSTTHLRACVPTRTMGIDDQGCIQPGHHRAYHLAHLRCPLPPAANQPPRLTPTLSQAVLQLLSWVQVSGSASLSIFRPTTRKAYRPWFTSSHPHRRPNFNICYSQRTSSQRKSLRRARAASSPASSIPLGLILGNLLPPAEFASLSSYKIFLGGSLHSLGRYPRTTSLVFPTCDKASICWTDFVLCTYIITQSFASALGGVS